MHNIEFDVAEVLEFDYTYQYVDPSTNPNAANNLFAIRCRSCGSYFNLDPFIAKPSDINIKRIPLVGEYVLIYRTYNQNATNENRKNQSWYYLSTIDLQSNIHANILPGISKRQSQSEIDSSTPGKTFKLSDRAISPLQPYEGDLLLEGRFGNSIRFGSTVDLNGNMDRYTVNVPWKGSAKQGDPIIILSNGRKNLPRFSSFYVSENIETDASTLYLTSTQKLPNFKLNNILRTKDVDSESSFNASQFIGVADRIILKSKSDIIVLDTKKSIEINTPYLSIGVKDIEQKEFGLHSTQVKSILKTLIDMIKMGGLVAGDTPVTINPLLKSYFQPKLDEPWEDQQSGTGQKIDNVNILHDKLQENDFVSQDLQNNI